MKLNAIMCILVQKVSERNGGVVTLETLVKRWLHVWISFQWMTLLRTKIIHAKDKIREVEDQSERDCTSLISNSENSSDKLQIVNIPSSVDFKVFSIATIQFL